MSTSIAASTGENLLFYVYLLYIAIILLAGLAVYMFIEPFKLRVRTLEADFVDLPANFDGFTMLFLSDLHIRKYGKLEKLLEEIVQKRKVDAILVVGDVTVKKSACRIFHNIIGKVPVEGPVFLVAGNSEHKPWLDSDALLKEMVTPQITLLHNRSLELEKDGQKLVFSGVDDPFTRYDDVGKALADVNHDDFVVFLAHCPSVAPEAMVKGADLVLSGHTHGGQVLLPFLPPIYTHMRKNKKLVDGLYIDKDINRLVGTNVEKKTLLVGRGVGTSKLHIRLRCRPEVIYVTLRKTNVYGARFR